jgi:oxygen-independent coproporphyrinogen-3 oxidase
MSVETSPATATPERVAVLDGHGVHRLSIGVQSFHDSEAHAAGRPQHRAQVDSALAAIRGSRVPVLNIDLIYGIPGQTPATWAESLRAALAWRPEELFLYPLYVRPLTGLGRRAAAGPDREWDAQRLDLYRRGRDHLLAAGYRQLSMRSFRRVDVPDPAGADYCCQDDGMVGLGCGARSYTSRLHYSFDYAVGIGEVRAIIDDYVSRPASDFAHAEYGFPLDRTERQRRWLVKSLLRAEGADLDAYRRRFGAELGADLPHLAELVARGWAMATSRRLVLTPAGLAHGDSIGPWLVSPRVRASMSAAVPR